MKKLTELEQLVVREFNLSKDILKDQKLWPNLAAVATYCMHNNYHYVVYDKLSAYSFLYQ